MIRTTPCRTCQTTHDTEAQTARCDALTNAQTCQCGGDLCGECMARAHAGLRPPTHRTETFGAGRAADPFDAFHRQQAADLRAAAIAGLSS